MDRRRLEEIAGRWMSFWRGGSLETFDAIHADDFLDHSAAGRSPDRDGLRRGTLALYEAFPDFRAEVVMMVVDAAQGLVSIRWTATGRMRGAFLGAAPIGRQIDFTGIEIIRIDDGRVVERWGEWDEGAILRQIGAASL